VRAALDEAAAALDRLRADDTTLARIAQAGELLAAALAAGGGRFPAATAARCATPCTSRKS